MTQDLEKGLNRHFSTEGRSFEVKTGGKPLGGYALAIFVVALTLVGKLYIPFTDQSHSFLLFLGAVLISAWYGGLQAGLLATFLSALAADYFFMPPFKAFNMGAHDLLPTFFFCLEGTLISWFCQDRYRAKTALRKGDEINRDILDSLTAHIAVLDGNGNIIRVNQAWAKFGRDNLPVESSHLPTMFLGINYLETCRSAADDLSAQQAFEGIRAVLDGHKPQFRMEYPCHSLTEERWFLLSATPLASYGYSGGGVVVSHLDISERHRAEVERDRLLESESLARENAEKANRSKDEFLAVVTHELRTPLHSILGWTQILKESELDEATKRQALEVIERNVRLQSQLVNDLLDVSRIATGKLSLALLPVELQSVVLSAMEIVELQAREKRIIIETEFSANPQILGDAQRLQQAIWNLLQNAIKFSPEGSKIQICLDEIEDRARLTVIDNGEGIKAEFLPRVFERFLQADSTSTRRHGGLGLGLAITHHVVELHEGTIAAFSDGVGRGAQFVVELPTWASLEPQSEDSYSLSV